MMKTLKIWAFSAVMMAATGGSALAVPGDGSCPVSYADLTSAISKATKPAKNNFWVVAVNRNGTVCAVAFSGAIATDQWLLSRQIAAAKAFTSNGLSLNSNVGSGQQISTAMLDTIAQTSQDKGGLYGVAFGNLQDFTAAQKGLSIYWGTATDPMVGQRVAGMITFGGGLPLVDQSGVVWGAIGASGDAACNDDAYARSVRANLKSGIYKFSNDTKGTCP